MHHKIILAIKRSRFTVIDGGRVSTPTPLPTPTSARLFSFSTDLPEECLALLDLGLAAFFNSGKASFYPVRRRYFDTVSLPGLSLPVDQILPVLLKPIQAELDKAKVVRRKSQQSSRQLLLFKLQQKHSEFSCNIEVFPGKGTATFFTITLEKSIWNEAIRVTFFPENKQGMPCLGIKEIQRNVGFNLRAEEISNSPVNFLLTFLATASR